MKFNHLKYRLRLALKEDGAFDDVTTRHLPGMNQHSLHARIYSKADGVFCGAFIFRTLFSCLDSSTRVKLKVKDGQHVRRGQEIARLQGTAWVILGGERTLLNLISHLSGIATLTARYVKAIKGSHAIILDTRKTTPLWRDLQKYAVKCGGGHNHRMGLSDAIMVKDNHHRYLALKSLTVAGVFSPELLRKIGRKKVKFMLVEAKKYSEVWDGIKARADIILLDNMTDDQLKNSIRFIIAARRALHSPNPRIEISGGITLSQAKKYAQMGADRISVGALTHSAPALDLSLEVL